MAIDVTAQWGAAQWGAAQWGGDQDSIALANTATSGVGIHASATCVLIAAVVATCGVGIHAVANGGDSVGATSGVGVGATASAVCSAAASSGVGISAATNGTNFIGLTALAGVGLTAAAGSVAHVTATSGIGLDAVSGSNTCRAGVGIHASATCRAIAPCSATSGIGIKALVPGHPQTVIIGTGPLVTFTPGTPSVMGPPQVVVSTGAAIKFTPGMPSVSGGPKFTQLFIGGVDRSLYLLPMGLAQQKTGAGGGSGSAAIGSGPISITSTTIGRATATFDLYVSDGYVPRATQTVILNERGLKLFAGCIKAVSSDPVQPGMTKVCFHVSCADKSSLCDGRQVIKTYVAGTAVSDAVLDVVANFLNGEGITTQGVDTSGAMGNLGSDVVGNYKTVTQVFDAIAAQTGATWWVDMNGVLNFSILSASPSAPISLSSTSDNFRNLVSTESTIGYANKFYAVSNLKVLPGNGPGSGQATREETYTFVNHGGFAFQQAAWLAGLAPGYVLLDLPIQTLVTVKINGTPVAVHPFSGGLQPGHGYYWFDGINTAGVIFPGNFTPSIGDVIVVGYIPVFQTGTVNTGPALTGTCGSGIVEGVIQVPNIQYQGLLDNIAAAFQARNGTIPFIVNFETDSSGLAVGQAISCDLPLVGLASTTLYITGVTLTKADAGQFVLDQTSFRCFVEASTQQNLGNWLTWYENLVLRTQFPLPLDRFESANFVLAPGSSLAGGAQNVNPYIVQNTGMLYASVGAAGDAPANQDLLIDFLVNGASVFGGDITKMLKIPAGSVAKQTASVFKSPGMYVFQGDLVTVSVTYSVTAANPVAAQSVTANLQWSY